MFNVLSNSIQGYDSETQTCRYRYSLNYVHDLYDWFLPNRGKRMDSNNKMKSLKSRERGVLKSKSQFKNHLQTD